MRIHTRIASFSLLLPLVVMGCTGSGTIKPGNGQLSAELVLDPVAGPRAGGNPPFLYAKADVTAVTFNAYDTERQISLGRSPLQLVEQTYRADLTTGDVQTLGTVRITDGTYQLDKIFIATFYLNTENASPLTPPRCSSGTAQYFTFQMAGNTPEERGIVPAGLQPVFDILGETPRRIRVTVNGPALTAILESHVQCATACPNPQNPTDPIQPPCATLVSAAELSSVFTAQLQ